MEKKGETKRQHYVPRMILRNFSKDKRRLSLVVLPDWRRIDNASIASQCYGDYFYGSDNVMEKSFAEEESKIAGHLGDLSRTRLEGLSDDACEELLVFVHYQKARTQGAAMHQSKFIGAFAKSAIRGNLTLNGDSDTRPEDLDSVEIGIKNAQNWALWVAQRALPIISDLEVKFIITDRTPGFIIADHPVVAYNQFAEHHPKFKHYPTNTGLAIKGLQLFFPLSPSVTLAIFDPVSYQYGGKSRVCRAGPNDVAYLNRMQAINAFETFYFDGDRVTDAALDDLKTARASHRSIYKKDAFQSRMIENPDGTTSQFVAVQHNDIRIGARLSIIRPLDGHSYEEYEGPTAPIRSPELMHLSKEYGKHLDTLREANGRDVVLDEVKG